MKRTLLFGMAVSLLAIAGTAVAYPTLLGPTGGANLPTASIVAPNTFNAAIDYYDNGGDFAGLSIDPAIPVRLLYGATPNFEIGASYTIQEAETIVAPIVDVDLDRWGVNAKYASCLTGGKSAWAIGGVFSRGTDSDLDVDITQVYWVGTSVLSRGGGTSPDVHGSLGVNWTSLDTDLGDEDSIRPFVSLGLIFPSKATLILEYQLEDDDIEGDALSSVVLRYPFTEDLSGQIGYTNSFLGVLGSDEHNLVAGINLRFGTK